MYYSCYSNRVVSYVSIINTTKEGNETEEVFESPRMFPV